MNAQFTLIQESESVPLSYTWLRVMGLTGYLYISVLSLLCLLGFCHLCTGLKTKSGLCQHFAFDDLATTWNTWVGKASQAS